MSGFSEKIHLHLQPPGEESAQADRERILQELNGRGYGKAGMTLEAVRSLYPLCRESGWDITVTLVHTQSETLVTRVEAGNTTQRHYGLAVDLGSTTVVMQMVHMETGEVLFQESAVNGQCAYGNDILTRIVYAKDDEEHREELTQAVRDTFAVLLQKAEAHTGISMGECPVMIVSGNTTMTHFLLGLDAWPVFSSPYAPVVSDPGFFTGRELGLAFSGRVYLVPAMSNYLGGDITSGLLTTDFYKKEGLSVFFDIGTNGELVVGNNSFLIAGAGAAGPALEGDISKYGMRAKEGAIDRVTIQEGRLSYTTIGGKTPLGICGSGIIDLIAQMRLHGWINIAGKLNPEASKQICYHREEGDYVVVYAPARESGRQDDLYFSQSDIMQYLDTKAAAHTMVDCLLESAGLTEKDITAYYTAGAFGTYADLESAITVGIFPDLPREKFHSLQNSSLGGARKLLLDRGRMEDIRYILDTVYCVQFASMPDFLIKMQAAKFIPHTDMERYPTVQEHIALEEQAGL